MSKTANLDDPILQERGGIFLIKGQKDQTSVMLISLAERLKKRGVLFVDAAHCFNQVFVNKNYHKLTLDLKGIYIARPFSMEQVGSIINKLGESLVQLQAKSVIISGFDKFIGEVADAEKEGVAEQLIQEISYHIKKHDAVAIIGVNNPQIEGRILPHCQLCTEL